MKTILSALGLSLLIFTSCGGQKKVEVDFIQDNIDNAVAQNTRSKTNFVFMIKV